MQTIAASNMQRMITARDDIEYPAIHCRLLLSSLSCQSIVKFVLARPICNL